MAVGKAGQRRFVRRPSKAVRGGIAKGSQLLGNWPGVANFFRNFNKTVSHNIQVSSLVVAQQIRSDIVTGIRDSAPGGKAFAPNHPFTIAMKGSSRPLIDQGDLVGNVTIRPMGFATFIGILRGTYKGKAGGDQIDLVNIATLQENGFTIKVTDKMRKYLAAHGLFLRKETTELVVPPRPFIKPVFDQWKDRAPVVFMSGLSKELGASG